MSGSVYFPPGVVRLPRRFSKLFKSEYSAFHQSIQGFASESDRAQYASLMLIRLMFVYFLQKKSLLDRDTNYLRNQLLSMHENSQENASFYRHFLLRFFHHELTGNERPGSRDTLPASIPALNSNLFDVPELERRNANIDIPNAAFARLFAFLDTFEWQIEESPTCSGNAITPGMLSYIFEKLISQKELGAYYTQTDISEYIARNTILPFLLHAAEKKFPDASHAGGCIWQLLGNDPDRYIYPALKKGHEFPLPESASGQTGWNTPASEPFALPGETWHEVIARRKHYEQLHCMLESGQVRSIDELVTNNLNIAQFAQDIIEHCEQPALLLAFYENLAQLTVLDPTCGSGAFLLAALSVLEPLYDACLSRMEAMLSACDPQTGPGKSAHPTVNEPQRSVFRVILKQMRFYPNRRYFILKSIITNNLYGVDIMQEAVELCKLRLLLKLLSQIERDEAVESLTAIDFNIHTGNILADHSNETGILVGYERDPERLSWFTEFYSIMQNGGFDVIIGNPPYVEYETVSASYKVNDYRTVSTGNLYALTIERCSALLARDGRFGMIVPSSATCTSGYLPLQKILLEQASLHISSFSDQRGKLFDIPHPRLCIILYTKSAHPKRVYSTPYIKLGRELRESLFQRLAYIEVTDLVRPGIIPRYGSSIERTLHMKIHSQARRLGDYVVKAGSNIVYYTRKMSWYVQVTPFIPQILDEHGHVRHPSELKTLVFASSEHANIAFVSLNSNLFYWFVTTGSDCRNLNMREVLGLPLDIERMEHTIRSDLSKLAIDLAQDLQAHSEYRKMNFKDVGRLTIQCIFPGKSKPIIDEVDRVLARHYEFTDEELNFIINYDGKYRN
ncbi:MAG TPA: DNA methyltransferase [Ktedonobacteraceae bacterium]|nr:DNA methyltransferase [Ktedonobacteraceae bacterium]